MSILPLPTLHFIRPWFLLGLLWILLLLWWSWQRTAALQGWHTYGDQALIQPRLRDQPAPKKLPWLFLFVLGLLCLAASGPAWKHRSLPLYTTHAPKVILLDLSQAILATDVPPNRLQRALFLTQSLLSETGAAPIGLLAYTAEPFVVSPLTEDAHTITALLPELTPDIMPIDGQNLADALAAAATLLKQAKVERGDLLIITGTPPDAAAIEEAARLAAQGVTASILPITPSPVSSTFDRFSSAGQGLTLSMTPPHDLKKWLRFTQKKPLATTQHAQQQWQDEGRWLLLPALGALLPVFRRRGLERWQA